MRLARALLLLWPLALYGGTDRMHEQMFATELFMVLITPIFVLMAALVEERKLALESLRARALSLERSLEALAKADRSKNEFIAVLAHELRNPLLNLVRIERLVLELIIEWTPWNALHLLAVPGESGLHPGDDPLEILP